MLYNVSCFSHHHYALFSIVLVNRNCPASTLFVLPFLRSKKFQLFFFYFNFVGLFSLFNFFFINDFFFILCHIYIHIYYILSQYVHALLVFNHPIILLFTFCFFIEHVYMYLHISICYFFHPFVMFIIFIQQYFASCHVEVSLFSFEYLHTVVCLLPVVYLPVVGLIHYQYTTHYRDCSHIFPYCLKREQYRAAFDNLYFSYRCACRSVMVIFFSYHYK